MKQELKRDQFYKVCRYYLKKKNFNSKQNLSRPEGGKRQASDPGK